MPVRRFKPRKLSAETKEKLLAYVRAGAYLETAAAACGLSSRTVREWVRVGARASRGDLRDFFTQYEQARALGELRHVGIIAKAAETEWTAAAWWLERSRPARWGRQLRLHVERECADIAAALKDGLDDDEFDRVAEILAARLDLGPPSAAGEE